MKIKSLLLIIILILSINSYSQIVFQNGYLINESNNRINCLIENRGWKNNPNSFKYKLSEDSNVQTGDLTNVKEFGIDGENKYIREEVNIDRSGKFIENLSKDKNPLFNVEKLFLQVVLEGKASLFLYTDGVASFFYKIDDSAIKQLIYKSYLVNNDQIAKNNYYREQLYLELKCEAISISEYEKLAYRKKDLKKIFSKYNTCNNSNVVDFENKEKRDLFNLSLRPRYNYSSFSINNSVTDLIDFNFDSKASLTVGIESEFIFPFDKNRWSLIVEPTYQYFKAQKTQQSSKIVGDIINGEINYKSIELPIGVRRYFFVNENVKIFTNASLLFDFSLNSKISFTRDDNSEINSYELKSQRTVGIGLGCKFKDRYSLEMRYLIGRSLLKNYVFWESSYKTASVIVGYSFF